MMMKIVKIPSTSQRKERSMSTMTERLKMMQKNRKPFYEWFLIILYEKVVALIFGSHVEERSIQRYSTEAWIISKYETISLNSVPEEPVVKKETAKKKVWKEDDRWNHDKFNEFDQAPKSREELIAIYGYDIRNEEGPPRARRRRRYG